MDDALRGAFAPLDTADQPVSSPNLASGPRTEWAPILPAPRPLPAAIRHPRHGSPSAVWRYHDDTGALLFAVCRFDLPGGSKEVVPYCCGAGGWRWKAAPAPRPLYGLAQLAARPDTPVLVVEGERTADAAATLFPDRVAMTWPGGALATGKVDWTPLTGRSVAVWPDADAPGRKAADAIAKALRDVGAASVVVVDVPADWPEGWDVADPLPEGVTADDLVAMLAAAGSGPGEQAPDDEAAPLDPAAEIARLAALPPLEFAALRRAAASRLQLTVRDLQAAVSGHRKRIFREREEAARERQRGAPGAVVWPVGFRMEREGLTYLGSSDDAVPVVVAVASRCWARAAPRRAPAGDCGSRGATATAASTAGRCAGGC